MDIHLNLGYVLKRTELNKIEWNKQSLCGYGLQIIVHKNQQDTDHL